MGLTRPTVVQLNTVVTEISDPISLLNRGASQANVDVGFVLNRDGGTSANVAFYWNETTDSFNLVYTTSTGGNNSNIAVSDYSDLRIRDLTGNTASFSGTGAIKIPTGNTAQRTSGTTGEIRFNTTTSQFEGYQGTSWSSLGGVRSVDNATYILAEAYPGAGNNALYFYTDNTLRANLSSTGLNLSGNVLATTGTFSGLTLNGNLLLTLPNNPSSDFTISSLLASSFKMRLGTTATNQYSWRTNLYYDGAAWQKDDATRGAWRMNQVVLTTDGTSAMEFNYAPIGSNDVSTLFALYGDNRADFNTSLYTSNTRASTSTSTGALVVNGGAGVAGNVTAGSFNTAGNATAQYFLGNGSQLTGINSFSNVFVSGQTPVQADSISDTLTLVGGAGITITTDAANDSITFTTVSTLGPFAEDNDFGSVTDVVTTSEDEGDLTSTNSTTYDLGTLVAASGLIYPDLLVLPSYTVAGLPSAVTPAQIVYVSNESGGAVLAFSDGTNWRRVTDRAIVS